MERGRGGDGHRDYEDMAVTHVLGGLSEAHAQMFRSHLLECADCRARVGELRAIAHELADVERDERRLRAAKSLETKSRESDEDDVDELVTERGSRWGRLVAVSGLLALTLLAGWNFVLRDRIAGLEAGMEQRRAASTALQFGDPWPVTYVEDGVDGNVRQHEGNLVLIVDGLEDEAFYGLYLLAADGDTVVYLGVARSQDGTIFPPPISSARAASLVVTQADDASDGSLTPTPTGRIVLRAEAP